MEIIIGILIISIIWLIYTLNKLKKYNDELLSQNQALEEWIQKLLKENHTYKKDDEIQQSQIEDARSELDKVQQELAELKQKQSAIVHDILNNKKDLEQQDFYRICLSNEVKSDIEQLEKIRSTLTNKTALDKLIYNEFIKRPLEQMEKRVLGSHYSGIYKITRLKTGEYYIGRSTDVYNRWQEHVKTAFNIGTIARSTLHTIMATDGIDGFSFELLEKVPKEELNNREKFYIDFYESKKLLNEKAGG